MVWGSKFNGWELYVGIDVEATKYFPLSSYTFWTLVEYMDASGNVVDCVFDMFLLIVNLYVKSSNPWPLTVIFLAPSTSITVEDGFIPPALSIKSALSPILKEWSTSKWSK